jgi:hypothetical protein
MTSDRVVIRDSAIPRSGLTQNSETRKQFCKSCSWVMLLHCRWQLSCRQHS